MKRIVVILVTLFLTTIIFSAGANEIKKDIICNGYKQYAVTKIETFYNEKGAFLKLYYADYNESDAMSLDSARIEIIINYKLSTCVYFPTIAQSAMGAADIFVSVSSILKKEELESVIQKAQFAYKSKYRKPLLPSDKDESVTITYLGEK